MIEPVAIYYEQCEPDWHVPRHPASNHIFLLVTGGSIVYEIGQTTYPLSTGDILFIPQDAQRAAWNESRHAHSMYVAHFHLELGTERLPMLLSPSALQVKTSDLDYMKQRFKHLIQQWLRKSPFSDSLCHAILLEMLSIFNEEAQYRTVPDKAYSIVQRLQQYILQHYRRPITIAELGEHVGRTPNYVGNVFKQVTGLTITDYIHNIRISAACDLLTASPMSIREVSEFLGFCEPSYFNKVFKKITGLNPSAFIESIQRP